MQDVYVPSIGRGGLGSSSQVATGDGDKDEEDDDDDDVDKRHDELGPSQLHDAPSTQPTQPPGTRCRGPNTEVPNEVELITIEH